MLERILTPIENWLIIGSLLGALTIGIAQVVMRYVFNYGLVWTESILVTLTVLGALIGGSRAAARGMHVRIMVVVAMFGPRGRWLANIFSLAATMIYCAFLIYAGWLYVEFLRMTGVVNVSTGMRYWIIFCIVPFTMTLFLLRYIQRARDTWHGTEENAEEFID